ncbi:hypothetical protein SAMN04489724_2019 [Algoriphagus locisalis]|uniref:Uncharacterized protein n=1 Tax=Algoriphagus locisalis TaxID=305507 RepID=A0A1I7AJY7_9BACT|nr:hypothetical protein SAMN04489724_2019 [Algoriphagus locisalis]
MKNSSLVKALVFTVSFLVSSYFFANWDEFKRGLRGEPSHELVDNDDGKNR